MRETLQKLTTQWIPNLLSNSKKTREQVKYSVHHALENPLIHTTPIVLNMLEGKGLMTEQERQLCPKAQYQFHLKIDVPHHHSSTDTPTVTLYSRDGSLKQVLIIQIPRNPTKQGIINLATLEVRKKLQEHIEGKLLKKMVVVRGASDNVGEASHQDFREIDINPVTIEGQRLSTLSQIFQSSRVPLGEDHHELN